MQGEEIVAADIAASFQRCVVEVLVEHAIMAAKDYHIKKLAIAGGVASNSGLRSAMEEACKKKSDKILSSITNFLHGQCSNDWCGCVLRIFKGNETWNGFKCSSKPEIGRTLV